MATKLHQMLETGDSRIGGEHLLHPLKRSEIQVDLVGVVLIDEGDASLGSENAFSLGWAKLSKHNFN